MDRTETIDNSLQDRINDYLSSFKSSASTFKRYDTAGDAGLEEYLLERAAEELRAAKARLDRLKLEFGRE
jgi:hypothetical protein